MQPNITTKSYILASLLCLSAVVGATITSATTTSLEDDEFKIPTKPFFEQAVQHQREQDDLHPPRRDTAAATGGKNRDVLLIIVDDMRPEMNAAYGRKEAYTPYFDSLARDPNAVVVDYAFSQYPLCSPSRTSFLCGKSPETLQNYKQNQPIPFISGNVLTLPQWFSRVGYKTYLGGKVFHQHGEEVLFDVNLMPNFDKFLGSKACLKDKLAKPILTGVGGKKGMLSTRIACTTGTWIKNLGDFRLATVASSMLTSIAQSRERKAANPSDTTPTPNFFMAVGFIKPHLPYYVHKTFWKIINSSSIQDVENWDLGAPQPPEDYSTFLTADDSNPLYKRGFNSNPWAPDSKLPPLGMRRTIKSAYLAAVAQSDNAVSLVMNTLQTTGLAANTLVIVTADHGFALGENRLWGKENLFDVATRVPLLFRVPWLNQPPIPGIKRTGPALFFESLDLYRTIAGFLNLNGTLNKDIEGVDKSQAIIGAISGNNNNNNNTFAPRAFSIVTRCQGKKCPNDQVLTTIVRIGYTVRTPKWRYTIFFPAVKGVRSLPAPPSRSQALQEELYAADDENDLLSYDAGASFATNHDNVAGDNPDVCDSLFVVLGTRYGW